MSRVITFSRTFPSYHPRSGEPTLFVEKLIRHLVLFDAPGYTTETIKQLRDIGLIDISKFTPNGYKAHTIRAGHRFKVGDKFSPRVWSGKPYHSKQIIIGPDIEVKKIWNIQLKDSEFYLDSKRLPGDEVGIMANHDGLGFVDFMRWFKYPKPFNGQVICWDSEIEYETD